MSSQDLAFTLGIDVGTSKVAAVILDARGEALATESARTNAELPAAGKCAEQEVGKILASVWEVVERFPQELLGSVYAIGVTGQMHGVLLWNSESDTSRLITWQDQRSSAEEIQDFRTRTRDISLQHGFGAVTLMWKAKNELAELSRYKYASTVHDFLVACLAGQGAVCDPTDAASWGLFDLNTLAWDESAIVASGVPRQLFSKVLRTGTAVGRLVHPRVVKAGVRRGIPVVNALGDNQASLYATIERSLHDVALTLGTGGQLSMVLSSLPRGNLPPAIDVRPYVDGKYIAVAASLCGGKSFAWLRDVVRRWCSELGLQAPDDAALYARLDSLGLKHMDSPLQVCASFLGERHKPQQRGEIRNIDLQNFSLGNIAAATLRDVIQNLYSMMPREFFSGRVRVVGSGNGLRQLPLAQRWAERIIGLPLHLILLEEEAAVGAAKLARRALG